jgi:hypothetical protein
MRHGTGICADARPVQPPLTLAAALVDLRQLGEAQDILRAADNPALDSIPARAALSLLRARIHLAAGRLAEAAAARAAPAAARTLGAHGYAAAAHAVLAVIELRRGRRVPGCSGLRSWSARPCRRPPAGGGLGAGPPGRPGRHRRRPYPRLPGRKRRGLVVQILWAARINLGSPTDSG